jgi:hypothetical protein
VAVVSSHSHSHTPTPTLAPREEKVPETEARREREREEKRGARRGVARDPGAELVRTWFGRAARSGG